MALSDLRKQRKSIPSEIFSYTAMYVRSSVSGVYTHTTDEVYIYKVVMIISLSVLAFTLLMLMVITFRVTVFFICKRQGQSHHVN